MDDLKYYFFNVELAYDKNTQIFGPSYMDMPVNEQSGIRIRDIAKQDAVDAALSNEIMYREAVAKGYSLTDEDNETINSTIDDMLENVFTEAEVKKNGFTREYLTEVLTRTTLAERYQNDLLESFDIDTEKIREGFDVEEYRQYEIEYFFITTQTLDEDSKSIPLDDSKKKEAKEKLLSLTSDAENTEDWSTLLPEDEEDVKYHEANFLKNDTFFSEEFKAMMMDMENGEVSQLHEEENGYYFVRMKDNNSMARYEDAVESAIDEEKQEAFHKYYQENIQPNHTYKVNQDYLMSLRMGQLTLDR